MTDGSAISYAVMRRVRVIRYFAPLFSRGTLAFLFLLAALWGISREVWVAKVIENMPSLADVPALLSFVLDAFAGTDLVVQALTVLAAIALVRLASDLGRGLSTSLRYA